MDITSTNSIFKITIPLLGIINHSLQGYASDTAFNVDGVELTENRIGVDGRKSSGFTPQLFIQNIVLQADSESIVVFDLLASAMQSAKDIYIIDGYIQLPSVKKTVVLGQGTLQSYKPLQDVHRVLEAPQYTINWGIFQVAPL